MYFQVEESGYSYVRASPTEIAEVLFITTFDLSNKRLWFKSYIGCKEKSWLINTSILPRRNKDHKSNLIMQYVSKHFIRKILIC